jgi:hypothetical protein
MGRRSRKRSTGAGVDAARDDAERQERAGVTRAERDAARRAARTTPERAQPARAPRPYSGRPRPEDHPPAPWGSFPLSELVILIGIGVLVWGFLSGPSGKGQERIAAGLVLASLGGGELALREHLAGFRSHSVLLAGTVTFAVVTALAIALAPVKLWLLTLVGVLVFAPALYGLRELFKRRSGGLGFR